MSICEYRGLDAGRCDAATTIALMAENGDRRHCMRLYEAYGVRHRVHGRYQTFYSVTGDPPGQVSCCAYCTLRASLRNPVLSVAMIEQSGPPTLIRLCWRSELTPRTFVRRVPPATTAQLYFTERLGPAIRCAPAWDGPGVAPRDLWQRMRGWIDAQCAPAGSACWRTVPASCMRSARGRNLRRPPLWQLAVTTAKRNRGPIGPLSPMTVHALRALWRDQVLRRAQNEERYLAPHPFCPRPGRRKSAPGAAPAYRPMSSPDGRTSNETGGLQGRPMSVRGRRPCWPRRRDLAARFPAHLGRRGPTTCHSTWCSAADSAASVVAAPIPAIHHYRRP
ncbi:conserved hypothetical protein, partial [Ricinus communis]